MQDDIGRGQTVRVKRNRQRKPSLLADGFAVSLHPIHHGVGNNGSRVTRRNRVDRRNGVGGGLRRRERNEDGGEASRVHVPMSILDDPSWLHPSGMIGGHPPNHDSDETRAEVRLKVVE